MGFYERYINGETESVYNEIDALGNAAFLANRLPNIEMVLHATFKRVAYNLSIIYEELKIVDYQFKTSLKYNFERPIHGPLNNTNELLKQLINAVKPFGYIPLSLQYFYTIVGGVNFAWDYETNENIKWELADPLQIASLDALVEEVIDNDWQETMREYLDENEGVGLEISADDLHKDNISGGAPYSVQLTKQPSIDSLLLNENHATTFINYLRICFDNCGFPGITDPSIHEGFEAFFIK